MAGTETTRDDQSAVGTALDPADDPGGGTLRSASLVGRGPERKLLSDRAAAVRRGGTGALWLRGVAGQGKTRLLDEVAELALRHGATVLRGAASPIVANRFGVVADAIRGWMRTYDGDRLDLGSLGSGLQVVVPEWPAAGSALDDEQIQRLAFASVVELVRRVGAASATVVLLDDLHWADAESLECVRQLVSSQLPGVLVVAASRPNEPQSSELADHLRQAGAVDVVSLAPLPRREIASLIEHLLGTTPPVDFVDEVTGRTDGSPLLVEEVVDAHVRVGSVQISEAGASWSGDRGIVPATTAASISRRLDRIDLAARGVLVAAAVVDDFDVETLCAVADEPPAVVDDGFAAGLAEGLLDRREGVVGFHHALFADAVLGAARPGEAAGVHRRAAARLAAIVGDDDALLARRAHHRLESGDVPGAFSDLVRAASASRSNHAPRRAETLARRALDIGGGGVDLADARDELASALAAQGRWAEALDVDLATSGPPSTSRWLRMASCVIDARLRDRVPAMTDLMPIVSVEDGEDGCAVVVMQARLALEMGDVDAAVEAANLVLGGASSSTCPEASQTSALGILAHAAEARADRATARSRWHQVIERATASSQVAVEMRARLQLSELEIFESRGDPTEVRAFIDVATRHGAVVEQTWGEFNLAMSLAVQGRLSESLEQIERAIERALQYRLDLLVFLELGRWRVLDLLGDPRADRALADVQPRLPSGPDVDMHLHGQLGWHHVMRGDPTAAIDEFRLASEAGCAHPAGIPSDGPYWLAVLLAADGEAERARSEVAQGDEHPQLLRWHSSPVVRRVALAIADDDPDEVDAAVESATGNMPIDLAMLLYLAATSVGVGRPHAERWLRRALDIFDAWPSNPFGDVLRAALRDAGGVVPRNRAGKVPAELLAYGVTAREAQVLLHLADNPSNAELSQRLFVSVRTVESHVSSLLRKLGCSDRSELADVASRLSATAPPAPSSPRRTEAPNATHRGVGRSG